MQLAEVYYNVSGLAQRILIASNNNQQIYVEQQLEALLAKGDLDVGFFYDCEQQWNVTSRFISLPINIDMSDVTLNNFYSQVHCFFFLFTLLF